MPDEPQGALTPTGEVQFWNPDEMSKARAGLPEPLRQCEELALIEHLDEAGRHWTAFVDGTIYRAAMSEFGDVHIGDDVPVRRNWWVDEAWVAAHILAWHTGWQGEADW